MTARATRVLAAAGVLAAVTACGGGAADPVADPSASPTASATPEAAPSLDCQPFPAEAAQALVLDTAREGVPPVAEAYTVETRLPEVDASVFVLAFQHGDKDVPLVHVVPAGQEPTARGTYVPLSSYAAEITGTQRDEQLRNTLDPQALAAALGCLRQDPAAS